MNLYMKNLIKNDFKLLKYYFKNVFYKFENF